MKRGPRMGQCNPSPTQRHMWRFQKRGRFGVKQGLPSPVYVFKCEHCQMTTATHMGRFWGKVY